MEKQIEQQAKSLPLKQLCSALKSQVPMEQFDLTSEKLKANQLFPLNQDKKVEVNTEQADVLERK